MLVSSVGECTEFAVTWPVNFSLLFLLLYSLSFFLFFFLNIRAVDK